MAPKPVVLKPVHLEHPQSIDETESDATLETHRSGVEPGKLCMSPALWTVQSDTGCCASRCGLRLCMSPLPAHTHLGLRNLDFYLHPS